MFIVKNALLNIACSKGRNILIGLIVLVIAVSSCVALAVKQAAQQAEEDGLKNLSITASISFDREKMMQDAQANGSDFRELMRNIPSLTLDEMLTYAGSSYVDDFRYAISTSMNGNDAFEAVTDDSSSSDSNSGNTDEGNRGDMLSPPGELGFNFSQGDFTVVGYASYVAMDDFVSGHSQVTDGEIFDLETDEYQCIISTELAAYNNLSIGDTITLVNPNDEEQTFAFAITGLYTYTSSSNSGFNMRFSTAMDPANQIYTSFGALNNVITYTSDHATITEDANGSEQSTALNSSITGTYVFASVDDYNSFTEDVKTMGLSDGFTIYSTDLSSYESSLLPIQNTAKFANMMLWIILGIGGIILIVLNIFNIRERKYEVGVLTAIGMKKGKVALQFVTELLVVTFIAIIVGTAIGAIASVPMANNLLEAQVTAQESQNQQQGANFGRPGQPMPGMGGAPGSPVGQVGRSSENVDYIDTLNATIDMNVVGQLMGIGFLLTIIASLAAVVFVMRYEPLKILNERT